MNGQWPFRWFGYWSGRSTPKGQLPSLSAWIDPSWTADDKAKIVLYLRDATCILAGAGGMMKCPLCDERYPKMAVMSDGEYFWPISLAHFVESHSVRLPDTILAHIRSAQWCPPKIVDVDPRQLPWPRVE